MLRKILGLHKIKYLVLDPRAKHRAQTREWNPNPKLGMGEWNGVEGISEGFLGCSVQAVQSKKLARIFSLEQPARGKKYFW